MRAVKFLLVGSGGREHALAWALAASPIMSKLWCAPGNAGIAEVAECVPIAAMDLDRIVTFAKERDVSFVVIGPEAPLVAGLWDRLEAVGIRALGPSAKAARLEGSKGFVKDLCAARGIPTAHYGRFDTPEPAIEFARTLGERAVIKMDGLAAGKGVIVSNDLSTTVSTVRAMFASSNDEIVVEEFLEGEEASLFVLSDGEHVLPLAGAEDHKRAYDGDRGPNTGGMGAVSPSSLLTPDVAEKALSRIVRPTIAAMAERGTPYIGVLYAGLMIKDGEPKLVEYNCRFGDPECQVLMMRLKSDLATALLATRDRELAHLDLRWRDDAALAVVMAARGYPGPYEKGSEIRGIEAAASIPDVQIFHAATERRDGRLFAAGGRVLTIAALGHDIAEARSRAYEAVDCVDWREGFCRRDIGGRALRRSR
ncbi:MAG TPA: phosphoribosylamine--glycine ligase [Rhizomicrobium sp.]|jgi:phosphoribosylamine--glycine ligase|nr:phosphoribosylamine--glycine ligase [Rhizomicrobium sp.]